MKIRVKVRGESYDVEIEDLSTQPVIANIGGERYEVWAELDEPEKRPVVSSETLREETPKAIPSTAPAAPDVDDSISSSIKAPIPGVILSVSVREGDEIKPGDELLVLEAMKMKNIISAEKSGKVKKILVSVGDSVSHNQPLIELD